MCIKTTKNQIFRIIVMILLVVVGMALLPLGYFIVAIAYAIMTPIRK